MGLIGGLLVSFAIPGVGIYGPTVGLLVSAILQVGILIPALVQQGVRYTFVWNLKHPGLHEILGLLIPNLIAVGIGSVGAIFDTAIASYLPDKASIPAIANAIDALWPALGAPGHSGQSIAPATDHDAGNA